MVHPDVDYPVDHEKFARLVNCPICHDMSSKRGYLLRAANLPHKYRDASFEEYTYNSEPRVALALLAQKLVDSIKGWATAYGPYGSGKSYLGAAAVNYALSLGIEARYWEMAPLLDHLREAYNPKRETQFSQLFHDICAAPLLVLDEVDQFKATDWAYDKFRQMISQRYNESGRCATLFLMNPEPRPGAAGFPAELNFLASRMNEFEVVQLDNADLRPAQGEVADEA